MQIFAAVKCGGEGDIAACKTLKGARAFAEEDGFVLWRADDRGTAFALPKTRKLFRSGRPRRRVARPDGRRRLLKRLRGRLRQRDEGRGAAKSLKLALECYVVKADVLG